MKDKELLEDILIGTINQAQVQAKQDLQQKMSQLTAGLPIPQECLDSKLEIERSYIVHLPAQLPKFFSKRMTLPVLIVASYHLKKDFWNVILMRLICVVKTRVLRKDLK